MTSSSLQLEDIHLISDEIGWLVRSRLPLEQHLADAGRGQGSRLEKLTREITEDLNRGTPLAEIVRSKQQGVPRILASAIAAGVRSGNLAATVEMMGDLAGDLVDLRRQILNAIAYPLTVVAFAWLLFVLLLQQSLIRIWQSTQMFQIELHPILEWMMQFNQQYIWWPWTIPAAFFVLTALWVASGRANAMAFRGPERALLLLPGVGGLLRDLRFSTLSRMMSILVEREVPLEESIRIAGTCCGSRRLDQACQNVASRLEDGDTLPELSRRRWSSGSLPPLLYACLRNQDGDGHRFAMRMRAVSEHYRARIELNSMWLQMLMPVCLFILIAGGTVVAYSLSIFWPMRSIYDQLGLSCVSGVEWILRLVL